VDNFLRRLVSEQEKVLHAGGQPTLSLGASNTFNVSLCCSSTDPIPILQHSWSAAENNVMEKYAEFVRDMSGGRIDISVFSDGEIVSWDELPDAVARGQLDMGHTHPDFHQGVVPEGGLEMAPYLWQNFDEEITSLYSYGIGDIYQELFEEAYGFHVVGFGFADYGAFMFTSPVDCLADMEGMIIMQWDPYAFILAKLTGASFVDLSAEEIYTALALGTIDGAEWGGASCQTFSAAASSTVMGLLLVHQSGPVG